MQSSAARLIIHAANEYSWDAMNHIPIFVVRD